MIHDFHIPGLIEAVFLVKRLLRVNFLGQLLTTKARHSIMLMILSKLYQDIKQEKNRRLVGFCFSLHTKAASRGNLVFCVQYICEIRRRLANRAAARFSMGGSL